MSPIPIVVCGRNPDIAKSVSKALLPEYDGTSLMRQYSFSNQTYTLPIISGKRLIVPVTHVNLSVEQAVSDIPLLLSSKTPPDASSNVGSQNYGARPVAVAVGSGFNDEMFAQMKEACGEESVVWARTDMTRAAEMPDIADKEAYGMATGERLKKCLDELRVGKEGGKTDGVYHF